MKIGGLVLAAALITVLFSGCSQRNTPEMQDGYYTAEASSFDPYGWKEFIVIYISNNKIVTVEYNAKNASGFIKSWDMDYMRNMNAIEGTYPNKYARTYTAELLNKQDPARIDAVSGATRSHASFHLLAEAAIDQAKAGDKSVVFVELPEAE